MRNRRPGARLKAVVWLMFLGLLFSITSPAWGEGAFTRTNYEAGLRFSFGRTSTAKETLYFYSWLPRLGVFLTGPHNPVLGKLRLSLILEGLVGAVSDHNHGWDLGLTPLLKLSYPFGPRLLGYLEGGAGLYWANIDSPAYSHTFNFSPQIGVGVDIRLLGNLALNLAYRFRHTSNAGIYDENPGVNSNHFMIGLGYYF